MKPRNATMILTVLVLVVVTACGSGRASSDAQVDADGRATIAVVGDSITEQSEAEIAAYAVNVATAPMSMPRPAS